MSPENDRDELLPEYDLDALGPPQRGRYYERYSATFPVVESFPDHANDCARYNSRGETAGEVS